MVFQAMKKMVNRQMVHGLPKIEQVNQVCNGCLTVKHRRTPFPEQAEYIAKEGLEMVHGDLYGPINPPTPSGKKMFLLMVDDQSRYMLIALLLSKDCAIDAIRRIEQRQRRHQGR
jgi:hypothetical protein